MKVDASIVSLGNWNPKIFTPAWVSEKVFEIPEGGTMQISLDDQQLTLTYGWTDIQFLATDKRIELRTEKCSEEKLHFMEACYHHISEMLPYTPVSAVGFNLNLKLTLEEYKATIVSELIIQQNLEDYKCNSHTFSAVKENAMRSFVVKLNENEAEIRVNYHYSNPKLLPEPGTAFEKIKTDLKLFLGYGFSI